MAEVVDFVAGWGSGAIALCATQPLDGLLVRLQVGSPDARAAARAVAAAGGTRAFWRGASPMMWSVPLQNAVLFTGYSAGIAWSGGEREAAPLAHVFIGGCAGGFAQSFVMSPIEMVKIRMQVLALDGRAAGMSILTGGNIFRGLGATMGRDVLPHGVWFATWEASKRAFARRENVPESEISTMAHLTSGGIAATVAWLCGYPFDVIKTRQQAENCRAGPENGSFSSSVITTARRMYAQEGAAVFWRGLNLKLARAIPQSAIGFYAYEMLAGSMRRGLG